MSRRLALAAVALALCVGVVTCARSELTVLTGCRAMGPMVGPGHSLFRTYLCDRGALLAVPVSLGQDAPDAGT